MLYRKRICSYYLYVTYFGAQQKEDFIIDKKTLILLHVFALKKLKCNGTKP